MPADFLHFQRQLPVLDRLQSRNVFYEILKIGDYEGRRVAIVGGGNSALDAALMVLGRHGEADPIVREAVPAGKADSLARVRASGRRVHVSCDITAAPIAGESIALTLTGGQQLECSAVIVQIGFLSARDTCEQLNVRLNEDGSIAVDPYIETSRRASSP